MRLRTLWRIYANATGIIVLAALISFGVIRLASNEGPVVEVVKPAVPLSTEIPYSGVLAYSVATRRLESCDGDVIYAFAFNRANPNVSVVISRPVMSQEIRPRTERVVRIELPDNVTPGRWRFQSVINSRCPTYARHDVIADFEIEVLEPGR